MSCLILTLILKHDFYYSKAKISNRNCLYSSIFTEQAILTLAPPFSTKVLVLIPLFSPVKRTINLRIPLLSKYFEIRSLIWVNFVIFYPDYLCQLFIPRTDIFCSCGQDFTDRIIIWYSLVIFIPFFQDEYYLI